MIKKNQREKSKRKICNGNQGFTLMETMATIFVFTLLMLGTTLMVRNIFLRNRTSSLYLDNSDAARKVSNTFVNELRNASYGANGAYPIGEASNTQMIFFTTGIVNNGSVSRVRYYVSGNILYKGVVNPAGSPLSYNLGSETVTPMIKSMSLGANPLFYYYDGNYNGTGTALVQPVNINQIKFVKINIIALKQNIQGSADTFSITAGASFRNLKTNLGN